MTTLTATKEARSMKKKHSENIFRYGKDLLRNNSYTGCEVLKLGWTFHFFKVSFLKRPNVHALKQNIAQQGYRGDPYRPDMQWIKRAIRFRKLGTHCAHTGCLQHQCLKSKLFAHGHQVLFSRNIISPISITSNEMATLGKLSFTF